MNMTQKLFIVYDGIENSVFQSQVVDPINKQITNNKTIQFTILSFEKKLNKSKLLNLIQNNPKIKFIIAKKMPFLGRLSLLYATKFLRSFLYKNNFYEVITRGPLAGYITLKALKNSTNISKLTIQARGLCAEEMRFSTQFSKQSLLKKILNPFLYKEYKKIEFEAYCKKTITFKYEIESVSNGLKEYLIKEFNADKNKITIAQNDIPAILEPQKIIKYKEIYRQKLEIPSSKIIYCYSGSSRPWQCGKETIEYFKKKYVEDKNSFLLIFSQDQKEFEKIIQNLNLEKECYKILSVKPNELIYYLCACDFGLLFRQKDIINWVSRPTKMLEYKSAGLEIIHNNNIEILTINHST